MDNVIDISQKLNGADSRYIWEDNDGNKWFKYSISYQYEDKYFSTSIWAKSTKHAEDMLGSLVLTGKVDGQILGEIKP